jgi:hypothetical protein
VNSDEVGSRSIPWRPWIMFTVGGVLFLLGVGRFVLQHGFGFMDALYCCLAMVPGGMLLLLFDYLFHHAKLALVIPLALAGVLARSFPVFDVALGLVLMGIVADTAMSERKPTPRF